MDLVTAFLMIGIAANALGFATLLLAGPIYAWNDRWIDRTHNTTADEDQD